MEGGGFEIEHECSPSGYLQRSLFSAQPGMIQPNRASDDHGAHNGDGFVSPEVLEDRFDQMTDEFARQSKGQRPERGTQKIEERKPFRVELRHAHRKGKNGS